MKDDSINYLVVTTKQWNRELFEQFVPKLPGNWFLITDPCQFTEKRLETIAPKFLFFPHWNWIVPDTVLNKYECVCFHMTDVPFGRGGSPLQNLIARGHKETYLTALQMVPELDAGPVYLKEHLSLDGPAHVIYKRAASLSWQMIKKIIELEPTPTPQVGPVTKFRRRTPLESKLPGNLTLEQVYDHIRMLDAPGYPNAFIELDRFIIRFRAAEFLDNRVDARCEILLKKDDG